MATAQTQTQNSEPKNSDWQFIIYLFDKSPLYD